MEHGNGFLYKNRIVEFASANGLVDNKSYQLTDRIIKKLVPDFKLKEEAPSANKCVDIIRYQDIARKKLYFDGQTSKQVDQLAHILTDTNFKKVQTRLKASGFRQGFACLFYGAPGTGKTELCLQLAKKTGRDVMQVNISQLRSMWVGGSEKNLQGLFDNYRDMVARSKKAPLLLFNEADAIIQKRSENSRNAVDKMENTLQNILLENIEKLDGILIATTNLQNTMDKAFERRFIYKIRFNKPTIEARTSIWKSMLGVNKATATQLAKNYEFSGGQIENIARKSTVDKILYGTTDFTFETLKDYCDSELIDNQQKPINRIGF
jgi:SpoVK/Ycf46/Vps4 family AAA+-type ATPase